MIVEHQFLHRDYFFPNWSVNTLFLGTFNPECGEQLSYYYGRNSNGFWKILKHYDLDNRFDFSDFQELKRFMRLRRFGCVDIIRRVSFPDLDRDKICGNGYSDGNLFRIRNYERDYNFEQIKNYIIQNDIMNILTTWGNRENPMEFRNLLNDFKIFCSQNEINYTPLPSPSGRLYKGDKIYTINNSWWNILDQIFD
jgi:G:T/U-mismatch repair DNA glycosylase